MTLYAAKESLVEKYAKAYGMKFKAFIKPSAPIISSISKGKGYVKISWNNVKSATHYRVYRRVGNGRLTYLGTTKNTNFYDKKDLVKGKTYRYYIKSFNKSQAGSVSKQKDVVY